MENMKTLCPVNPEWYLEFAFWIQNVRFSLKKAPFSLLASEKQHTGKTISHPDALEGEVESHEDVRLHRSCQKMKKMGRSLKCRMWLRATRLAKCNTITEDEVNSQLDCTPWTSDADINFMNLFL